MESLKSSIGVLDGHLDGQKILILCPLKKFLDERYMSDYSLGVISYAW